MYITCPLPLLVVTYYPCTTPCTALTHPGIPYLDPFQEKALVDALTKKEEERRLSPPQDAIPIAGNEEFVDVVTYVKPCTCKLLYSCIHPLML